MPVRIVLMIVIFSLLLMLVPEFQEYLIYDNQLIINGEYWRLLTGHLVHVNSSHYFFDACVLLMCSFYLAEKVTAISLIGMIVFCAISISLILLLYVPEMQHYAGLSGIGYMLVTITIIEHIKQTEQTLTAIIIGTLCISLVFFSAFKGTGFIQLSDSVYRVAWQAHLVGVCVGVIYNFIITQK